MEPGAVLGRYHIPVELGMPVEFAGLVEQGGVTGRIGCCGFDCVDRVHDGIFGGYFYGRNLLLDDVDPSNNVFTVGVALPSGKFRVKQRAVDIVHGVFGCALPYIGHVAVRTGDSGVIVC